jgi:hypothetical protein
MNSHDRMSTFQEFHSSLSAEDFKKLWTGLIQVEEISGRALVASKIEDGARYCLVRFTDGSVHAGTIYTHASVPSTYSSWMKSVNGKDMYVYSFKTSDGPKHFLANGTDVTTEVPK